MDRLVDEVCRLSNPLLPFGTLSHDYAPLCDGSTVSGQFANHLLFRAGVAQLSPMGARILCVTDSQGTAVDEGP